MVRSYPVKHRANVVCLLLDPARRLPGDTSRTRAQKTHRMVKAMNFLGRERFFEILGRRRSGSNVVAKGGREIPRGRCGEDDLADDLFIF